MTKDELIARLEGLTGPDREADGEVMFSLFAKPAGQNGYLWPEDDPSWAFAIKFPGKDRAWFEKVRGTAERETIIIWRDGDPILMNSLRVPPLTASLDAAIALVERMLPGCRWRVEHLPPSGETAFGKPCWATCGMPGEQEQAVASKPAIALLIALLRSLKA